MPNRTKVAVEQPPGPAATNAQMSASTAGVRLVVIAISVAMTMTAATIDMGVFMAGSSQSPNVTSINSETVVRSTIEPPPLPSAATTPTGLRCGWLK
jgi:hypothetical protein